MKALVKILASIAVIALGTIALYFKAPAAVYYLLGFSHAMFNWYVSAYFNEKEGRKW